jgi:hypothetical protein
LDDALLTRLREEAARGGTTMSALVEEALRQMFLRSPPRRAPPSLPVLDGGRPNVDVADREALEAFLEEHDRRAERRFGPRGDA